jgi:hypothetical protein
MKEEFFNNTSKTGGLRLGKLLTRSIPSDIKCSLSFIGSTRRRRLSHGLLVFGRSGGNRSKTSDTLKAFLITKVRIFLILWSHFSPLISLAFMGYRSIRSHGVDNN